MKTGNEVSSRTCSICKRSYSSVKNLRQHMYNVHEKLSCEKVRCQQCGKEFRSNYDLRRHRDTHIPPSERAIKCPICGLGVSRQTHLTVHMNVHTGKRPYKCRVCDKTFGQASTRNTHEFVTHSDIREHVCTKCGKSFKMPVELRRHLRSVHSDARPHVCETCGRGFKFLDALNTHRRRLHLPFQNWHVCNECPMKFKDRKSLKRHVNSIHLRLKPHQCPYCDRTFTQAGNLQVHVRVHTGERPYRCSVCNATFSHSGTLSGHMISHHQLKTKNIRNPDPPALKDEASN